jgi:hypothetical protein
MDILSNKGGCIKTSLLVSSFQKRLIGTPKQTVYRSIASLKEKEVIVIAKGITSVNTHWIGILRQKLDVLESHSLHQNLPDRVSYIFPSLLSLTPVWTHHVNILINQTSTNEPIIFINPHQWFFVAREWSESQLVNKIESDGYTLWQGINHISTIDRLILKEKFTNRSTIHGSFITPLQGEKETYITVIGDYVIKVTTTNQFSETINKLYADSKEITPEFVSLIEDSLKESGTVKIVISKNINKARQYRNMMKKFIA